LNKKKIFVCCTEQSGENICYNILKLLNSNNLILDGVCGNRSKDFLRRKYFDISEFKSIGLFEIIFSIRKYLKMIKFLKDQIKSINYDLIICIDSPDFNYNLVKSLRRSNYSNKIIQIVAPSVWAWRKTRAKKFATIYDEIFLLFDFEKKYFQYPQLNSTFIGHPIYHINKRLSKKKYNYISFLLGSRENEINKLFIYFDTIEKYIYKNNLNFKIFIPTLPHLTDIIKSKTRNWKTKTFICDNIDKFDEYYDDVFISLTCSGTASLEIAKRNIPQIVIYKLNFFTEIILKYFVNVKYACLLNIVSKKMIIPEIVNSNLSKRNLLTKFDKLFNDEEYRKLQIENINYYLPNIVSKKSPYEISVERILTLL